MNNWTWHEKYRLPIPKSVSGTGYALTNRSEDNTGFERDEKTGLFLPADAAKSRRKVKIGFGKESE